MSNPQLATGPGATENTRRPRRAAPVGIPASRLPHPLQVLLLDGRRPGPRRPPGSRPRLLPSLRPRAIARPRAVSRRSTGRPGPLGTFDDAFGGGEVEVPPGHDPLGLLPVRGDLQTCASAFASSDLDSPGPVNRPCPGPT